MLSPESNAAFEEYARNVQIEATIGYFDDENDFFLSEEDQALIHQTYEVFYFNRMNIRLKVSKPKKERFRPIIN